MIWYLCLMWMQLSNYPSNWVVRACTYDRFLRKKVVVSTLYWIRFQVEFRWDEFPLIWTCSNLSVRHHSESVFITMLLQSCARSLIKTRMKEYLYLIFILMTINNFISGDVFNHQYNASAAYIAIMLWTRWMCRIISWITRNNCTLLNIRYGT